MKVGSVVAALILASVALVLRWPDLSGRPLHNDEAVNAVKFASLYETGAYRYDPNEHHGPTLYYATLAVARLTGSPPLRDFSEARFRWVTLLFGLALIPLVFLCQDGLGRNGTTWAGLWLAVSPAMVFYSRYFIHEILLIFATLLALGAAWRYWKSRRVGWAVLCGVGTALMVATKETFVITFGAIGVALFLNGLWNRMIDATAPVKPGPGLNWKHLAIGFAAFGIVATVLFTSFFSNWAGIIDAIRTFLPWLERAKGESPHINPWYFYLERILWFHPAKGPAWTELAILVLAGVAAAAGFLRKGLRDASPSFVRFLTLYAFFCAVFYSAIPYKTPWCLLNFWLGALLLAGTGAAVLLNLAPCRLSKLLVASLLATAAGHLAWQAWELGTTYSTDRRNPHIYAQTSGDVRRLLAKVNDVAAAYPEKSGLVIKVIAPDDDYWPLPWYLREFRSVGYWPALPQDPFAPVMIVSAKLDARLDERGTHLMVGYFELRPQVFLECYVEKGLWTKYLTSSPQRSAPTSNR